MNRTYLKGMQLNNSLESSSFSNLERIRDSSFWNRRIFVKVHLSLPLIREPAYQFLEHLRFFFFTDIRVQRGRKSDEISPKRFRNFGSRKIITEAECGKRGKFYARHKHAKTRILSRTALRHEIKAGTCGPYIFMTMKISGSNGTKVHIFSLYLSLGRLKNLNDRRDPGWPVRTFQQ